MCTCILVGISTEWNSLHHGYAACLALEIHLSLANNGPNGHVDRQERGELAESILVHSLNGAEMTGLVVGDVTWEGDDRSRTYSQDCLHTTETSHAQPIVQNEMEAEKTLCPSAESRV